MAQLLGLLSPIGLGGTSSKAHDDDFMDRVHHTYTVMVLVIVSVIVSTKQYVGDPIHCWVPGHFTRNHESYASKACWVSNTYYLPTDERIPLEGERRQWINYYQWLPMILLTQAAFFYIPVLVWRGFNGKIGVQINHIVDAGKSLHDPDKRQKNLSYMVQHVDRYLGHYRDDSHTCLAKLKDLLTEKCNILCGKKYGNFLAVLYVIVKFLYFANCLGQLFIMDVFLGTDFHFYGIRALRALTSDEAWPGSTRFPTFTLCDYKVRQMGQNIHRNTIQCVLPINFFNEKLYLALWIWFFIVCIATGANLFSWLLKVACPLDRLRYVKRHLRVLGKVPEVDKKYVKRFIDEYLRQDGVMIVRLVQMNTSDMVASQLTAELFDKFKAHPPQYSHKMQQNGMGDMV